MASKRKVTQNDLRKMMAEMKSSSSASSTKTSSKKLKLSARELALLEEEKRSKAQKDQEKLRLKQEKMSRIVPNKDLQPKKSILKNTSTTSNFVPPEYYKQMKSMSKKKDNDIESGNSKSAKNLTEDPISKASVIPASVESDEEAEESGKIPEGFFDDPKLDAKARQVQYVNVEEEEWQKFQKEIAEEEVNAQEILTEDRNEATTDRQIEEIDEQIEAWKRVAELEVKKETITQIKTHGPISGGNKHSDDESSSDSDVDPEELLSWRKKC